MWVRGERRELRWCLFSLASVALQITSGRAQGGAGSRERKEKRITAEATEEALRERRES